MEHVPSECSSTEPLPVGAYTWLVNHLSKEGNAVVDVCSSSGYAMVTALKAGGKALRLSSASQCELKSHCQRKPGGAKRFGSADFLYFFGI